MTAVWMDCDPAGALRAEYGHQWCIRMYSRGGDTSWSLRRWHPAPAAAVEHWRVLDSWEGSATASQVRAWLARQDRAMGAYRASA